MKDRTNQGVKLRGRPPRRRNPVAKALIERAKGAAPIPGRKRYRRKLKHPKRDDPDASSSSRRCRMVRPRRRPRFERRPASRQRPGTRSKSLRVRFRRRDRQ